MRSKKLRLFKSHWDDVHWDHQSHFFVVVANLHKHIETAFHGWKMSCLFTSPVEINIILYISVLLAVRILFVMPCVKLSLVKVWKIPFAVFWRVPIGSIYRAIHWSFNPWKGEGIPLGTGQNLGTQGFCFSPQLCNLSSFWLWANCFICPHPESPVTRIRLSNHKFVQ